MVILQTKKSVRRFMMKSIENAIDRIKNLECPTGEVEIHVADILEDYQVANRNNLSIFRSKQFDKDGAKAYSATFNIESNESLVILVQSGLDDYVAKVTDAYITLK